MYQKQNFLDGDILKDFHLNNIENCIDNLKDIQKIPKLNSDFESKNLELTEYIKNKPFEVYFDDTIYDCTDFDPNVTIGEGVNQVKNSYFWIDDFLNSTKKNIIITWTDGIDIYNDSLFSIETEEDFNRFLNGEEIPSKLAFLDGYLLSQGQIPKNILGIIFAIPPESSLVEIGIIISKFGARLLGMDTLLLPGLYLMSDVNESSIQMLNIQLNIYRVNYNIKYTGFFESLFDADILTYITQDNLENFDTPIGALILLDNEQPNNE